MAAERKAMNGIESASERMGSFLAAVFNPPPVPGEHRFVQRWVPRLDEGGRPVLDEFGEPEMVPDAVAPYLTIRSTQPIPRFTGILTYLKGEQL